MADERNEQILHRVRTHAFSTLTFDKRETTNRRFSSCVPRSTPTHCRRATPQDVAAVPRAGGVCRLGHSVPLVSSHLALPYHSSGGQPLRPFVLGDVEQAPSQ